MREVRLLVERGLVETERVDNIDDGLLAILDTLVGVLSGRVGSDIWTEENVRTLYSCEIAYDS